MQRQILSIGLIVFMTAIMGIYGCGDQDLLDQTGDRYQSSLSITDAGEDDWLTIDTVRSICSTTTDEDTQEVTIEYEDWTDVFGDITITIDSEAPGLNLLSYSIDYISVGSINSDNGIESPPDLIDPPDGYDNIYLPSGGTSTFTIPIMTVDTKDEFAIDMTWLYESGGVWDYYGLPDPDELQIARYRIRITLHFENEYGIEKDITLEKTVYLSNYDNC